MKRKLLLLLLVMLPLAGYGQRLSVKTNLLYDATTTANLGLEVRLATHSTIDLGVSYNPWTFRDHKKIKLLLVQPEYRYWFCEAFDGHFIGVHLHGGAFNFNKVKMPFNMWPGLKSHNYQGTFYGAGVSWGYQWILSNRWGLEFTLGLGYVRGCYNIYSGAECGDYLGRHHKNYWGPTKVGLNLIFHIF